jgi:regulation of enolase protein 1 (concanavalin A-like superfamily)
MRKRFLIVLSVLLALTLTVSYGASFAAAAPAYNDEFTTTSLQPFWEWVNPTTSSYSLTDHAGWLRITAPTGVALVANKNAPRLLQNVTGGFVATTCVNGSFTQSGYRAGLLLWKDAQNFIRLEKMGSNQILFYGYIAGHEDYVTISATAANLVYLKLEKSGSTITASWSTDDITWHPASRQLTFASADPLEVGVFVINVGSGSTPFSADFDYFHITPAGVFVLPEYPLGTLAIPVAIGCAFFIHKRRSTHKA